MAFLLRYLLLGPVSGVGVAVFQQIAAVAVWLGHGCPDFYFRGWNSIFEETVYFSVGGFLFGLPYGLVICSVREAWRIRPAQFLIHLWLIAFLVQLMFTSITIAVHPRLRSFPLVPEAVAALAGLVLLVALPGDSNSETSSAEDAL